MPSSLTALVLAAGLGKRMKSSLPKVLHPIAGRPLVHYPIRAALEAGAERVVVVASPETQRALEGSLQAISAADRLTITVQNPPRGTGDAARVGVKEVHSDRVLILCGDTPLLRIADLSALLSAVAGPAVLALLTCSLEEPAGYGRVLRDGHGQVREVREDRDLTTPEDRSVREVNTGVYAVDTAFLREALGQIQPVNAQGEYYLTDVVALAAARGGATGVLGDPQGLLGVNDRVQLVEAERLMYQRVAERHGRNGVTVRGDARIDDTAEIGEDTTIETGVVIRGQSQIGSNCFVDVGCVIADAHVAAGTRLRPYSVVSGMLG